MSPHLFAWDSLDRVTTIARSFSLLTVIFFALGLLLELISLWVEDKKYHDRLQWIGLLAFFLCAGAEFGAYKYDGRRDFLVECKHQDELRTQEQVEDDLRRKLKEAQDTAEQSSKNANDARQETEELKKKMAWRTISPGNQKSIAVRLKKFSGQPFTIRTFPDDDEAINLAEIVLQLLLDAGWSRRETTHVMIGVHLDGVSVEVAPSRPADFEPAARALTSALNGTGLATIEKTDPGEEHEGDAGMIHIRIGRKGTPKGTL